MNQINDRVKQVRTVLKMTQVNFAKKIYISQAAYNDLETGQTKINERMIQLISTEFNINKEWIKTGNGDMFDIEKPDIGLEHLIDIYKQLDNTLKEYLLEQSEIILKLNNENTITKK
jgi:transcriptional regulator with XRE-family HTH domain